MAAAVYDRDIAVKFFEIIREFGVSVCDGGNSHIVIRYCPWCGTALPPDLRDRWFDELEALGIDDPLGDDDDKVPQAFLSDQWYQQD
jgi:hypothetical protein